MIVTQRFPQERNRARQALITAEFGLPHGLDQFRPIHHGPSMRHQDQQDVHNHRLDAGAARGAVDGQGG
ncbi:MAG: hypothetical protein AAFR44_17030, partial [Pseudomonadota bacterium]